jgi:putative intracellular protease/amidase
MDIAILIYEGLTALDAIGPYETLSRVPGTTVTFVAAEPGLKRTDTGYLGVMADASLAELARPEVVVVPGGPGQIPVMSHEPTLEWLRAAHAHTQWITSVCTGSLILGAAGLLEGKRATSHWMWVEMLPGFGAEIADERVVVDGRIITAAGVSAGIDMGLTLASRLAGEKTAQAIQLAIEYDPDPPFDSGSVAKASPEVMALARKRS